MSYQTDADELFDIKNSFHIGNFQHVVNEAQRMQCSPENKLERDIYLYRALIGQRKFGVVLSELKSSSPPPLQALRILASYLQNTSNKDSIVEELEQELKKCVDVNNVTLKIVAATIYSHEDNYEAALRVLNQSETLECRAMMVHAYLKMNRLDCAKKELKNLLEKDDDATLTQLAQAWVHICSGGEKLSDALYIFQELIDKNSANATLLNGQAVCHMCLGKYEEAESLLQEALEKEPNNAAILTNLIAVVYLAEKPTDMANRYVAQLRDEHKRLPFVQDLDAKEREFDRVVNVFA